MYQESPNFLKIIYFVFVVVAVDYNYNKYIIIIFNYLYVDIDVWCYICSILYKSINTISKKHTYYFEIVKVF